ncbi:polyphosphate kinase 2 family protein [Sphingobacteriales bacterium CHB3]|nr:polyphosphate kinase 2 family protein [Sphingobacteriales bacterium CHB3]
MNHNNLIIPPGKKIAIKDYDPGYTDDFTSKSEAKDKHEKDIERLAALQEVLYAHNRYSLLLIFQAMDAAGKDGVIKHVMSGVNPQGCQVFSFKAPSQEELDHDFMWRTTKALPERGRIGIFNRSYYEEVLIVRVHPEILNGQNIPDEERNEMLWQHRFEDINNFERYLSRNGTVILKFFLNVSKKEQKERFLERIERPEKNWKFSFGDVTERARWDDYMHAYEEMLNNTSTKWAPWHIIPADKKWFTRAAVADIIVSKLESLDMKFPEVSEAHKAELLRAKEMLESE